MDGQNGFEINKNKEVLYSDGYQKLTKDRFVGREYYITNKEQILPLYELNLSESWFLCDLVTFKFYKFFMGSAFKKNKQTISKMIYNIYWKWFKKSFKISLEKKI